MHYVDYQYIRNKVISLIVTMFIGMSTLVVYVNGRIGDDVNIFDVINGVIALLASYALQSIIKKINLKKLLIVNGVIDISITITLITLLVYNSKANYIAYIIFSSAVIRMVFTLYSQELMRRYEDSYIESEKMENVRDDFRKLFSLSSIVGGVIGFIMSKINLSLYEIGIVSMSIILIIEIYAFYITIILKLESE